MLSSSGHVYAMGSNKYGQLGLGGSTSDDQAEYKSLPCLIESLQTVHIKDIAAGNEHSLALSESGKQVFSWGMGKYGALGTSKSQNVNSPSLVDLKPDEIVFIAAGSRHSAFISHKQDLYMCGNGTSGQLGLGQDCTDRAFKPQKVETIKVLKVALGDTHSLLLSNEGFLYTTGANDKYQLGIDPEQRDLKLFNFQRIVQFKLGDRYEKYQKQSDIEFKDVFSWNLNAAIDSNDRVYLWGILHDKSVKQSLCIKIPERVNSFKVETAAMGPTMAMVVDKETKQACVIGINAKGELGLGDNETRKTFCVQQELREKKIRQCDIGKNGFVIAVSDQII